MVANSLSGGVAPLFFKLGSRQMRVVRLSALTTLLPEKMLELEAVWVMEMAWIFWKRNISISPDKI